MVGFYKHDIPAWMDGTETLSDGAYRAYHVVVQLIMLNEGPITLNERGIAGRCNTSIKSLRKSLQELIEAGKIELVDGRISNVRAEKELQSVRNNRENAGKGGQKSAEQRQTAKQDHIGSANSLENNAPAQAALQQNRSLKEKRREEETREEGGAGAGASAKQDRPPDPGSEHWLRTLVGEEPVVADPNPRPVLDLLDRGLQLADIEAGIAAAMADPGFRPCYWRQLVGWIERAAKDRLSGRAKLRPVPSSRAVVDPAALRNGQLIKARAFFRGEWGDGWEGPKPGEAGFPEDVAAEAARKCGVEWPRRSAA